MNYKQEILRKIMNHEVKDVFIASDFFDIAGYQTVRSILNRLVKDGEIVRIIKGIYYKPKCEDQGKDCEIPHIDDIAEAIARKYNWTIAPTGNTALGLLGLSNYEQEKLVYISDGRYASFEVGESKIEFKRINNTYISKMSKLSATVIQSIKAIGKDKITLEQINNIRTKLSKEEKTELLSDGKKAPVWVYGLIKEIAATEM